WINHRLFAVTVIYAEFYDPAVSLPPHALLVNLIGDADICGAALDGAEQVLTQSRAPIINLPSRVRATGRAANSLRLGAIPGVVAPTIAALPPAAILCARALRF